MIAAGPLNYLANEAPFGHTFPQLCSGAASAEEYRLTRAQVEFYRQHGYLHNVSIMSAEQIARLRDGLEAIVNAQGRTGELIAKNNSGAQDKKLTYMQGAWMIDEAIHDLVFHPAITVKLSQLLDTPRVRFWHDQVFYKPPRTGSNVAWHQDYSYWTRSTPSGHITVWIGLDDSRQDNGCLQVIPGSHTWPLLKTTELAGDMEGLQQQLSAEQRSQFKPVPLEQPVGTCSFHHDHTVHGSYPNRSERPRRAIILNYMKDGTRSAAEDGVLMPGFKPIPKGEPICGDWFPLVIDLRAPAPSGRQGEGRRER